jgi:hypothetical protein
MGFENRKSKRVKAAFNICFWPGDDPMAPPSWGVAANFSETGLAFFSEQAVAAGSSVLVEFSPSETEAPFRLFAQAVFCEKEEEGQRYQIRLKFHELQIEERQMLRYQVLQIADPKLGAVSGWGRALFGSTAPMPCSYHELQAEQYKGYLETKAYFSSKELAFLKKFQAFLDSGLGSRSPGSFRLVGSLALKEHALAWLELELPLGRLHLLAEALWCSQPENSKAEAGLNVIAYNKDEALRIEKGA